MPLPKKDIPLPEMGKFIPPDTTRNYFEFAGTLPFNAQTSTFSPANALWLAEASFASYGDDKAVVNLSALTPAGVAFSRLSSANVQFLKLESQEAVILAFRGTRIEGFEDPVLHLKTPLTNWSDLVTDFKFIPCNFDDNNLSLGRVHRGFRLGLDAIIEMVRNAVASAPGQPVKKLWLTGHSLGAALATVAAVRLAADGVKVQGVYTYGSPRVGDEAFINKFPVTSNTWRFVHHRDLVTTLPPAGLYGHVGNLRQLTKDGRLLDHPEASTLHTHVTEGFAFVRELADVMTKDFNIRKIDTFPVPFEALADHAPIYYANKIWNLQA